VQLEQWRIEELISGLAEIDHGRHLVNTCSTSSSIRKINALRDDQVLRVSILPAVQLEQWRIEELVSGLAEIDHGRHLVNTCSTLAQAAG